MTVVTTRRCDLCGITQPHVTSGSDWKSCSILTYRENGKELYNSVDFCKDCSTNISVDNSILGIRLQNLGAEIILKIHKAWEV